MVQRISEHSRVQDSEIFSHFLYDPATTTGLTFGYQAGQLTTSTGALTIAAGTEALTDDDVNFVYVSGTLVSSAVTTTAATYMLYRVTTASGVITLIEDLRGTVV